MENKTELFRAWLRKYVKEDRKITAVELADKLGMTDSVRISHYHSGRVDHGNRTYPKIPYKIMEQIVEIVGIPYEQILEEGRNILDPPPSPAPSHPENTEKIRKFAELVKSQKVQIDDLKRQVADLRGYNNMLLKKVAELEDKLEGSQRARKHGQFLSPAGPAKRIAR